MYTRGNDSHSLSYPHSRDAIASKNKLDNQNLLS